MRSDLEEPAEKPRREELDQPPIDFSFKNLTALKEIAARNERPRALRVGRAPTKGPNKKYMTRSIWLNNNNLEHFSDLEKFVNDFLEIPEELGWLDLSFNNLTDIDDSIEKFENLRILYLHGNNINTFEKLQKLKGLKHLRSLTLHGNPIEAYPNYRSFIVHTFPQVINLDFSPVTPKERTAVYRKV